MHTYSRTIIYILTFNLCLSTAWAGFRPAPEVPKKPSILGACARALIFQYDHKDFKAKRAAHREGLRVLGLWETENQEFKNKENSTITYIQAYLSEARRKEPNADLTSLELLVVNAVEAVRASSSIPQIDAIFSRFPLAANLKFTEAAEKQRVREKELAWQKELLAIISSFEDLVQYYARQEMTSDIKLLGLEKITRLKQVKSKQEAEAIIAEFEAIAPTEVSRARAARKDREKRQDIALTENTSEILTSFIAIFNQILGEDSAQLSRPDFQKVVRIMDLSAPVKKFIYDEMQWARRIQRIRRNESTADFQGAKARMITDIQLIRGAITSGDSVNIKKAMALRTQIKRINQPLMFKDILLPDARMERTLNRTEREVLLAKSMAHDELAALIILAASKIPAAPQKPSSSVHIPKHSAPQAPKAPKELSSYEKRSRSKIENYNRQLREYKRAYTQYLTDHHAYSQAWGNYKMRAEETKVAFQNYANQVAEYRDLLLRHQSARQTLLLFIVKAFPEVMSQDANDFVREAHLRLSKAKSRLSRETRREIERNIHKRQRRSDPVYDSRTDDDFWFWYFYVYNPWWNENYGLAHYYLAPALDEGTRDSQLLKSAFDPDGILHSNRPPLLEDPLFQNPTNHSDLTNEVINIIQDHDVNPPSAHHTDVVIPDPSAIGNMGRLFEIPSVPTLEQIEVQAAEIMPEIPEIPAAPQAFEAPTIELSVPEASISTESGGGFFSGIFSGGDSGGVDVGGWGGDTGGGGGGDGGGGGGD